MHKHFLQRLSLGALNLGVLVASIFGLSLRPMTAGAVSAESVSLGSSELRVDTGSAAGAASNAYFAGDVASDAHGHVYHSYLDARDGGASLYVGRSSDYGGSYAATDVRVDAASGVGTAGGGILCTDGAGSVYVLFSDTREAGVLKFFMAVSRDYGASFGTAARVGSSAQALVLSGAALRCDQKGNVYVVWTDERTTATKTDIYFQRSADYGATWLASDVLIDSTTAAGTVDSDSVTMDTDWSGRVFVTYDDARNGGRDIFFRGSTDYGSTWGAETIIDGAVGGTDINPSIDADRNGNVTVAWQTGALAPFDLRAAGSKDSGATWSAPVQVNTGTNIDTGAAIAEVYVDSSGVVLVTYRDVRTTAGMQNVFINRSTDFGATFAATDQRLDLGRADGSATADPLIMPTMDADKFGNVLVGYSDDRTAAGDFNVFANTSEDLGATWGATDTRISTGSPAGRDANDVRVTLDDRARGHVHYRSDRTTAAVFDIYSRAMNFTMSDEALVREGGSDRYGTAAIVSSDQHAAKSVDCMVVASGENFPDALAGVPLAAWCQGPMLLTKKGSLPAATATEIARAFDSVDDVETDLYVLGGSAAVTPAVVTALGAIDADLDVKVLSGATRVETALAVAAELDVLRGAGPGAAWIARSDAFPDALVVGAAAGSRSVDTRLEPVLLTPTGTLNAGVAAYLASKTATLKSAFIAGGTSAISAKVMTDVDTIVDTTTRYGGINRYDTGKIINTGFFGGARTPLEVTVASGVVFADPLSGGPAAAANDRPIALSKAASFPTESTAYVTSVATTVGGGRVLGGVVAIQDAVKSYVESLF